MGSLEGIAGAGIDFLSGIPLRGVEGCGTPAGLRWVSPSPCWCGAGGWSGTLSLQERALGVRGDNCGISINNGQGKSCFLLYRILNLSLGRWGSVQHHGVGVGTLRPPDPTAPAPVLGDRISPRTSSTFQPFQVWDTALQTRSKDKAPAPAPWCGQP